MYVGLDLLKQNNVGLKYGHNIIITRIEKIL